MVLDRDSSEYIEGRATYDRMLEHFHLYVCKDSNHTIVQNRTLLHRATDWMNMEKLQGKLYADVCIVPFASGGNGQFAGNYTGWPEGLGISTMHTACHPQRHCCSFGHLHCRWRDGSHSRRSQRCRGDSGNDPTK